MESCDHAEGSPELLLNVGPSLLLSVVAFCLPSVSLSLFIFVVTMRKCWRRDSCTSFTFSMIILENVQLVHKLY